ncbi:MAG: S-layer homology domain-containing protein [Candidatus Margulisiibacteriota bacterium]
MKNNCYFKFVAYFVFCSLSLVFSSPVFAVVDLTDISTGARPLGMGNAYSGGLDDASAIFTNPAALTLSNGLKFTSMSGSLLADANYLQVGIANNSALGMIGIGYVGAGVGGIPIVSVTASTVEVTGLSNYNNGMLFLSWASELNRFTSLKIKNVSVGANFKYLFQGYTGGGTTMEADNGRGYNADIGLLWQTSQWARLGLDAKNLFTFSNTGSENSLPPVLRIGGSFKILGDKAFRQNEDQEINLMLDYELIRGDNYPHAIHTGVEYYPLEILALRFGLDQKPKADTAGVGLENNFTAGLGLNLWGFAFDYAYHQYGEIGENTTHFFSIGYLDYKPSAKKKLIQKLAGSPLPPPIVVPKPILKTYTDVPENYWAGRPIEYLATMNIMPGFSDGTFRPDLPVTRGELAEILVKAKGFKLSEYKRIYYSDLRTSDPAAPYITVAVARKYMQGYSNNTFRSEKVVTRAEAAVIFANFSGLYVKDKIQEKVFPDMPVVHTSSPALASSKEVGLFEYLSDQRFNPNAPLTRAEAAEILSKTEYMKEKIKNFISMPIG